MSESAYRIAGIFTLVISIFFILGGLFIPIEGENGLLISGSLIFGIILLATGTALYKIVKTKG